MDIPRDLFSDYEERAFRCCTRCGESLADFPGGFQISKAFKGGECVFEFALCDHCRTLMMEEFSTESKKRLGEFERESIQFDRGLAECAVCGAERDGLGEFTLTGVCAGDSLRHSLMVCGGCADTAQGLLSDSTKDTWRRFVDENFPGPPPGDALPLEDEVTGGVPGLAASAPQK
jgi:hypothetical protein